MTKNASQVAIANLLSEAGFAETGQIANPGVVRYVAGQSVGGKFSYRMKFRRGNIGCTVGARTTCIYRIGVNGPEGFTNIPTKDVPAIRETLSRMGATDE